MATDFRNLIFQKNGANSFGPFKKGDHARGAYPDDLIESYLAIGILKRITPEAQPEVITDEPQPTAEVATRTKKPWQKFK